MLGKILNLNLSLSLLSLSPHLILLFSLPIFLSIILLSLLFPLPPSLLFPSDSGSYTFCLPSFHPFPLSLSWVSKGKNILRHFGGGNGESLRLFLFFVCFVAIVPTSRTREISPKSVRQTFLFLFKCGGGAVRESLWVWFRLQIVKKNRGKSFNLCIEISFLDFARKSAGNSWKPWFFGGKDGDLWT